jgi:glycosyltransferase involved in cell wall biosynthesis
MKIAFVSTRGIPNNYGGLEEFAEHVAAGLAKRGHDVIVYNPHTHPYDKENFNGVRIKKKYSPENKIGTAANFIYDYLSLKDAIHKEKCDVVLVCGYTTASISFYLCSFGKSKIITNIDGLEWKRSKWNYFIQKLTVWFEKIAVQKSHALVADNIGIEKYLEENFRKKSYFIPYAANLLENPDESLLEKYQLEKHKYFIIIARLEPENNIEMILDGVKMASSDDCIHIFANSNTKYGKFLKDKYKSEKKIIFRGWASNQGVLNQLRHFSKIYFHGHSVGGTNPSLLEAMAAETFIAAHDNIFNRHVLGKNALYFSSAEDVRNFIDNYNSFSSGRDDFAKNNLELMKTFYNWDNITGMYEKMFLEVLKK